MLCTTSSDFQRSKVACVFTRYPCSRLSFGPGCKSIGRRTFTCCSLKRRSCVGKSDSTGTNRGRPFLQSGQTNSAGGDTKISSCFNFAKLSPPHRPHWFQDFYKTHPRKPPTTRDPSGKRVNPAASMERLQHSSRLSFCFLSSAMRLCLAADTVSALGSGPTMVNCAASQWAFHALDTQASAEGEQGSYSSDQGTSDREDTGMTRSLRGSLAQKPSQHLEPKDYGAHRCSRLASQATLRTPRKLLYTT